MPSRERAPFGVDRRSLMTGVLGAGAASLVAGVPRAAAEARAAAEKGGAVYKVVDVSVRLFKWPVKPGKDHTGFTRERRGRARAW